MIIQICVKLMLIWIFWLDANIESRGFCIMIHPFKTGVCKVSGYGIDAPCNLIDYEVLIITLQGEEGLGAFFHG